MLGAETKKEEDESQEPQNPENNDSNGQNQESADAGSIADSGSASNNVYLAILILILAGAAYYLYNRKKK